MITAKKNTQTFVNLMHSYGLFNVINKPTRVTQTSSTLIDHIWTSNINQYVWSGIIYEKISDHFPVSSFYNIDSQARSVNQHIKAINGNYIERQYRVFSDNNINNFNNDLLNVDWTLVTCSSNPNVVYQNFFTLISALFNKNFPLVKSTFKIDNKPYIDNEIKNLIKEKINTLDYIQNIL